MAAISPQPKLQFFNAAGAPLVGGKLWTYTAGTTTLQSTYTDQSGGSLNTNPVILDSRGECSVWLGTTAGYKLNLRDATGVEIWTVDHVLSGRVNQGRARFAIYFELTTIQRDERRMGRAIGCLRNLDSQFVGQQGDQFGINRSGAGFDF